MTAILSTCGPAVGVSRQRHQETVGSFGAAWRRVEKYAAALAFAIVLAIVAEPKAASAKETIFISPVGNDAWSGSLVEPNAQKTDGPLATPARARDVARAAKAAHPGEPIQIQLRGGTYFLHEPLTLTSEDSGSEKAPITWSSYQNESAIISGGVLLTGVVPGSVESGLLARATVPESAGDYNFREIWFKGKHLQRARWPKKGTLAVADTSKAKTHADWRHPESEFPFVAGDLKAWPAVDDAEVVVTSRWVEARLPVTRIDLQDNVLHSSKLAAFHPETGDRYYIENIRQCLSEPFEWCHKPGERTVYVGAGVNDALLDAQFIVPRLPQLLRMDGTGEHPIEYLTFRGLTFSHSEWYYDHVPIGEKSDSNLTGFNQAAIGVPGAVVAHDVHNISFDHCTISHVGSYAIELGEGAQNNRITDCTFTDLGAGGVKIGETAIRDNVANQSFGNVVSDCHITDGGNLFPSAVGLWIGQSHDNVIAHNEIGGFWYTGISVGWTWGYSKSLAQNNRIEFNEIHHIGIKQDGDSPILSDMGGIYTLGNEHGTVIRNNIFHDIGALHYGGWGIYFDEGTTDILAENNLVYRTTHGGFHQHYGKDNVVRNNIFAFSRDMQIQRTRIEDHTSFTFENNIVYWKTGFLLAGDWKKLNVKFDHNTYWHVRGEKFTFGPHDTWSQWRDKGMDQHSMIADPLTNNPESPDFHVLAEMAKSLGGFAPFDWAAVGPR